MSRLVIGWLKTASKMFLEELLQQFLMDRK